MKFATYIQKFLKVLSMNQDYIGFLGKRKTIYFVILAVVTSFLNSLNYVALIPLASSVIDGDQGSSLSGILPDAFDLSIYWLGAIIIITFFIKIILNILFSHWAGLFGESYLFNIRMRMIKKIDQQAYENGVQSSSQVLHFNNMIPRIGTFNWSVFSLVAKILSSLFLFCSLLIVSMKLAIFALAFVAVWGFSLLPVLKLTRKFAAAYAEVLRKIQAFIIEEIEAREIIKVFRLGEGRNASLQLLSHVAIKCNAYLSDIRAVVANLQEFLIVITGVVILCAAKQLHLEVGYVIAYGYVFSKFIGSLNDASNFLNSALEAMPPTEEILCFVNCEETQNEKLAQMTEKIDSLEYLNLSFSWGESRLFDIQQITLKKGNRVLIRGKNGEGKSTLLKLMSGLIKAQGLVTLNQQKKMQLVELFELHHRFSYLPQTAVVFDGPLSGNILLNSGKSIDDIDTLLQAIGIDLNEYFPDWKSYRVVESGKSLSGGEVQLIALLRALVRDFDIIFIDEFANHLSQKLVKQFDQYLSSIQDKIIICVSHAPVSFFNQEYMLEEGRLSIVKAV